MNPAVVPPAILALADRAADLRALLIAWCDQNSGSGNHAGLAEMLDRLCDAFASLPGTVETLALAGTTARALRVCVRPTAGIRLCLSGHYDTVYPPEHPFQRCTQTDETTLVGPGVADMKGGLVVMLAAMQAFEQTPAADRIGYEIILNPDEEIGTPWAAAMLTEAAGRHQFGLVFEPARADGSLVRTRMGTGHLTVTCHGRAAHAARAADGHNAIAALAELLVSAHRLPAAMPGVLVNIGTMRGGTAVNMVPDSAEAVLDVRVSHPDDNTILLDSLAALAAPLQARSGCHVEFAFKANRPPKESGPPESAAFEALQAAAHDLRMEPLTWVDAAGGSDGNLLRAAGLPNLDGLGPVGGHYHSSREYVELPSLVARAQLVALFLHRLAAGEPALVRQILSDGPLRLC